MNKTLVIILNHNRKAYTNQLYESLFPYKKNNYDLLVMDNGSTIESEKSHYTTLATDQNCYYGGSLNLAYELFLEHDYDSLLFMNNDIILHGYNFVEHLRKVMFEENFAIVSPSVIQPEVTQCYWNQMHSWASTSTREVKWVDFMCPLIRRDVIEEIKEYDTDLIYGWGQDVYTGLVCAEKNWKIGVTDVTSVIHLSSQTFKDGKSDITMSEYSKLAQDGMYNFFAKIGKTEELGSMRRWGNTYTYDGKI